MVVILCPTFVIVLTETGHSSRPELFMFSIGLWYIGLFVYMLYICYIYIYKSHLNKKSLTDLEGFASEVFTYIIPQWYYGISVSTLEYNLNESTICLYQNDHGISININNIYDTL